MENITVKKADLIEKIKANRDQHRDQFLEAQKRYREKAVEELDKRLEAARKGEDFSLGFAMPVPEDFTKEYDAAIAMLEWEVDDEIELTQHDFERFVLNRWEWARAFAANTMQYLS